jgi:hypothetical protein
MIPVKTHKTSIHAGEPMSFIIIEDTMNIPDPIIDPATSRVASRRPKDFCGTLPIDSGRLKGSYFCK